MSTTFDPYSREAGREVLHGHRGLLGSIEPEDETLPCGEVVSTQREGDGLVVSVRWDGSSRECTYVLSVEAAPPERGDATDIAASGDAALTQYTEPPPRPTGSNIAGHAWDELDRAGLFTGDGDFYGGMTCRRAGTGGPWTGPSGIRPRRSCAVRAGRFGCPAARAAGRRHRGLRAAAPYARSPGTRTSPSGPS